VRLVRGGALSPDPVLTVSIGETGEGGLLGIAADPDFSSNHFFYIYYTASKGGQNVNRVERYRLSDDSTSAALDRTLIDDVPAGTFHDGGRLHFGPDGKLYVGTGDGREPDRAQDNSTLSGKVLRLNGDGSIPSDNPNSSSPIFLSGVRNVEAFDWLNDSTMIVADHGPTGELGRSGSDEVTFARAGENLGWPTLFQCQGQSGMVSPAISWVDANPPGGAVIYRGNEIPEWQGSLLIGNLGSDHLQRLVLNTDGDLGIASSEVYLKNQIGRIREVIMTPTGELFITTSNCDGRGTCGADKDVIYRVRHG
jgi:glucose/arabinose dehydrogenase